MADNSIVVLGDLPNYKRYVSGSKPKNMPPFETVEEWGMVKVVIANGERYCRFLMSDGSICKSTNCFQANNLKKHVKGQHETECVSSDGGRMSNDLGDRLNDFYGKLMDRSDEPDAAIAKTMDVGPTPRKKSVEEKEMKKAMIGGSKMSFQRDVAIASAGHVTDTQRLAISQGLLPPLPFAQQQIGYGGGWNGMGMGMPMSPMGNMIRNQMPYGFGGGQQAIGWNGNDMNGLPSLPPDGQGLGFNPSIGLIDYPVDSTKSRKRKAITAGSEVSDEESETEVAPKPKKGKKKRTGSKAVSTRKPQPPKKVEKSVEIIVDESESSELEESGKENETGSKPVTPEPETSSHPDKGGKGLPGVRPDSLSEELWALPTKKISPGGTVIDRKKMQLYCKNFIPMRGCNDCVQSRTSCPPIKRTDGCATWACFKVEKRLETNSVKQAGLGRGC